MINDEVYSEPSTRTKNEHSWTLTVSFQGNFFLKLYALGKTS